MSSLSERFTSTEVLYSSVPNAHRRFIVSRFDFFLFLSHLLLLNPVRRKEHLAKSRTEVCDLKAELDRLQDSLKSSQHQSHQLQKEKEVMEQHVCVCVCVCVCERESGIRCRA
jgi:cell shape-determining protein MreC